MSEVQKQCSHQPISQNQSLLRDLEDATTSDEAEGKNTDEVDARTDFSPQCHEADVAEMAFYALSHAECPTTDHYHIRDPELIAITDVSIDTMTEHMQLCRFLHKQH